MYCFPCHVIRFSSSVSFAISQSTDSSLFIVVDKHYFYNFKKNVFNSFYEHIEEFNKLQIEIYTLKAQYKDKYIFGDHYKNVLYKHNKFASRYRSTIYLEYFKDILILSRHMQFYNKYILDLCISEENVVIKNVVKNVVVDKVGSDVLNIILEFLGLPK